MWLTMLLAAPVAIYLILAAVLYFAQTASIFPGAPAAAAGPPPPGTEALELTTPSGDVLHGVLIPATEGGGRPRTMILGFAGNAWNSADAAEYLHTLFPEADVAAFHYRGYAPSTGRTSAEALQQDSLLAHDFLRDRLRSDRTVAVGLSVGSGVAAYLAAHRPLDGLILVTPFDSLAGVAASHYPWLPVRLLMRHELEPARDLAGSRDTVIPPARTEALRRAIPNLVFARNFDESGHNDIYEHPGFRPAMRESLAALLAPPAAGN